MQDDAHLVKTVVYFPCRYYQVFDVQTANRT